MAGRIRHSHRAQEDLLGIWRDVAAEDPAAADRLYDRLEARLRILHDYPEVGRARPDIAADARMLVEDPYLILYRVIADGVQVVRVLHGARDISGRLFATGKD